jgi:hypothetical protein
VTRRILEKRLSRLEASASASRTIVARFQPGDTMTTAARRQCLEDGVPFPSGPFMVIPRPCASGDEWLEVLARYRAHLGRLPGDVGGETLERL